MTGVQTCALPIYHGAGISVGTVVFRALGVKLLTYFVAVGSSLVVLFFVIGFCSESIDVKDEMRFESILRMLIRLGLAEWFVANNVTIMKAFFTSIGNLVGLISAGTTTQLAIDSTQADIIKGLGFGESLVMLILTALLAIIIIICGLFIIYTV